MILVSLLNPKFAIEIAAGCVRTSGSGHLEFALTSMVGVTRHDGDRAIDLLEQHDASELVRPRGGAETDRQARFLPQAWRKPVIAANDECHGFLVLLPPSPQPPRK